MTEEQKQELIDDLQSEKLVLEKWRDDWNARDKVNYQAIEIALAALTQPANPAFKLPDGWRLMPDEPTEEMMRAMYQAQDMWPSAHCDNMRETQMSFARPRYIAALATAPKAPSVPHTAPIEPICATGGAVKLPLGVEVDEYHGVFIAKDEVISAIHAAGHQVED